MCLTMIDNQLVLAYIGNGKSANRYHIPFVIQRKDKFVIKTIFDPHVRHDVWAELPGVTYTENPDEVFQDPEIDLVVVNTRPDFHYEYTKRALESGKHCLCEKPFMPTRAQAQEIFTLAKEKGLYCSAYQNRRYDGDFLTVQKVIESRKLGDLLELEMHYDYYRPQIPEGRTFSPAGSYLYGHGCHTLDQVISYFGEPDRIHYDVRQLLGEGRMNDYFDIDMYYGTLKVSVKSSYFRVKSRPKFIVYGKKGMFVKETDDRQEEHLKMFYMPGQPGCGRKRLRPGSSPAMDRSGGEMKRCFVFPWEFVGEDKTTFYTEVLYWYHKETAIPAGEPKQKTISVRTKNIRRVTMEKFQNTLAAFGAWENENKYLSVIKNAFQSFMPFIIMAAVGTLWTGVLVNAKNGLGAIWPPIMKLSFLNPAFSALNFCTQGIMALCITFFIGLEMARVYELEEKFCGFFAVAALVSVTNTAKIVEGAKDAVNISGIFANELGASGLFTGMIIGIVALELFRLLYKVDALKIKLPPQVPAGISKSFEYMIPGCIVLIVTSLLSLGVQAVTGGKYLNDLIFSVIQKPLMGLSTSLPGVLAFSIISSVFWAVGLHGDSMISGIVNPLMLALIAENAAAVEAGGAGHQHC